MINGPNNVGPWEVSNLDSSWFPIRVIYRDTNEEVLVKTPSEVRKGVSFIVTEVRVKEQQ